LIQSIKTLCPAHAQNKNRRIGGICSGRAHRVHLLHAIHAHAVVAPDDAAAQEFMKRKCKASREPEVISCAARLLETRPKQPS